MDPREVAVQAFRAAEKRCRETPVGPSYIHELERLCQLSRRDPFLSAALGDLVRETQGTLQALSEEYGFLLRDVTKLREELAREFPGIRATEQVTNMMQNFVAYQSSLARFDRLLTEGGSINQPLPDELIGILNMLVAELRGAHPTDAPVVNASQKCDHLGELAQWLGNEVARLEDSSPGRCWLQISELVDRINVKPAAISSQRVNIDEVFKNVLRTWGEVNLKAIVFSGRPRPEEIETLKDWKKEADPRLARLGDEVAYRLQSGRARQVVLRRYAARSMWYRRHELLRGIKSEEERTGGIRQAERWLASDAAAYLFDQGFTVLTEVRLDPVRLDILVPDSGETLLIEAKIFRSPAQGKRAAIEGLAQLLDYHARLRAGIGETFDYLLIFRIDGGSLALPEEPVLIHGRKLEIVFVDLAGPEVSGSNARAPEAITISEIVASLTTQGDGNPV